MKMLVSIHDVTAAHERAVRKLWALCVSHGVTPALFVVPNWHGAWPLEESDGFMNWLRERAADGCEIFLHGFRHDEVGLSRSWTDELRAVGRTNGEAEFLTLRSDAARLRIALGIQRLRAVGLSPIGFVAPAWLARPDAVRVAADLGLALSEDTHAIYFRGDSIRLASPVVRWSARGAWRPHVSATVASARRWYHRNHEAVRIALHPEDLSQRTTVASITNTVAACAERRTPSSYAALMRAAS